MKDQEQLSPQQVLQELAARHGFSLEAVQTLRQALVAGGGTMAQFSHPEFGGAGQWTRSGMLMIGDMFNHALKARVAELCSELAHLLQEGGMQNTSQPVASYGNSNAGNWWGTDLGNPAASGSQNDARYAYFPATQRLAVFQANRVTLYDTGSHRITGVSQQQSSGGSLTFTSQHGTVRLADLPVVPGQTVPEQKAAELQQETSASQPAQERSEEIFYQLERLAELHGKGILSEQEFLLKKTELLARL